MIDLGFMTRMHSIQYLQEHLPHQLVVSIKHSALADVTEQIATRAIVHDEVIEGAVFEGIVQRHDVAMLRDMTMKGYFTSLACGIRLQRTSLPNDLYRTLDRGSIRGRGWGLMINGAIDNSVGASAEELYKFVASIIDNLASKVRHGICNGNHRDNKSSKDLFGATVRVCGG